MPTESLGPGDHVEANASSATEKLHPVSGVINRMAGQGGGYVETQDGEVMDQPVHITPGGAFHLMLPSGSYRLKVHSVVEPGHQLTGTREITVGEAPLESISITLEPPVVLPVEVEYQAVATSTQNAPSAPPPAVAVRSSHLRRPLLQSPGAGDAISFVSLQISPDALIAIVIGAVAVSLSGS